MSRTMGKSGYLVKTRLSCNIQVNEERQIFGSMTLHKSEKEKHATYHSSLLIETAVWYQERRAQDDQIPNKL